MSRTLFAGLLGCGFGAALLMVVIPADLFGRVPALSGHLTAAARDVAVIDGQTLRMRDTVLRLEGVSAPARGQICSTAQGGSYDCGATASQRLANLMTGHEVACELHGRDPGGLPRALCTAGEISLNSAMMTHGAAQ